MPRTRNTKNWPVMPAKCASCPFNREGDEVRANVESRLVKLESSQICHHPVLYKKKETHLCRGGRDFQLQILHRIGLLKEPTDACFTETSEHFRSKP